VVDAARLPDLAIPVREIARGDVVRLDASDTVGRALEGLRSEALGERIIYFYVTDSDRRLTGVVPTRRLLLSDPALPVSAIMIQPVTAVRQSEPFRRAVELMTEKHYLALPVVDAENRLTGVVDIGNYTGEIVDWERREAAEEIFQLAGVHIEQEKSRGTLGVVRSRFPWLLCNLVSGLLAALISQQFDDLLCAVVALAFFVPLVLTLSESIAMQSVAMSLTQVEVAAGLIRNSARREVRVGFLSGAISGGLAGMIGLLWLHQDAVAWVVAGGIVLAGAAGAGWGYFIPRLVRRWRLDPQIASGPAVLAVTDITALLSYFGLAWLVL
jgi:magnesium transporter